MKEGEGATSTQHPLQNSWQGFRHQRICSAWHGKGSCTASSSCSLNIRLPQGIIPARARTSDSHNLLPAFTTPPTCSLPTFRHAEVETALATTLNSTQPLPLCRRAALPSHKLQSQYWAVGELGSPSQIQQKGNLSSANRTMQDIVQRDKADPACFGCSSLSFRDEDYITMSTLQAS